MGNIIYFIAFPESKQNRVKCPLVFNPNTNEDKNIHFLVVIHSLSYNFYLLKQNVNATLCFSKVAYLWLKLSNVKVSESMLMYKPK